MKQFISMFKKSSFQMARVLVRFVPLLALCAIGIGYGHTRSLFLLYTIALFALVVRPAKFRKDWGYVYSRAHCIIPITVAIVLFYFIVHVLQHVIGLSWSVETFIGFFFITFFIMCLFVYDTGHGIVPFTQALYYTVIFIMRNIAVFLALTVLVGLCAVFFLPFFIVLMPLVCVTLVWWYSMRVYADLSYYCES